MTQWKMWRILAVAFAVAAIGVATVVVSQLSDPNSVPQALAQDGDDDSGDNTRTHESCYNGAIFDYSASLSELDFGSLVRCTSWSMLFIRADAYLYRWNDSDDDWSFVMSASRVCFVRNNCTAERTIDNPAHGDYQLQYCFRAHSIGSTWPYSCRYAEYEVP